MRERGETSFNSWLYSRFNSGAAASVSATSTLGDPVRFLPTSLTLAGFTVLAGLAGCSSDAPTPGGSSGAPGASGNSGAVAGAAPGVPGAGASGAPVVGTAGSGSGGAPVVGSAGSSPGGGSSAAGANTVAGGSSTGGSPGTAGGGNPTAGAGSDVDQGGKKNAPPGTMTSMKQDYLRLGEVRILNNNWGSAELGCNAPMSVFVNQDKTFGWTFNRGNCDTANSNQKPDFPQIEFGIHPFGKGSPLVTSPEFSSTTLLPLQIKDITSASVTIDSLNIQLQKEGSWNITFEFWISERNPVTDPNPGVYAELMTFWGWQAKRWPDQTPSIESGSADNVSSGGKTYKLMVQDNSWANGWRYFQFRASDGPQKSFNGKVDVKPLLDYLVNTRMYSKDFWVTRLEIGSEIDDETQGTVTMKGITFEVNGQNRSAIIGTP
jgi:hypothetical protein